jgi:hypothetical protein
MAAFRQRNVMMLIESIAGNMSGEDGEIFRQAAGDALASGVGALSECPGGGVFSHTGSGESMTVSWQARPRITGGAFLGLLWIFRAMP